MSDDIEINFNTKMAEALRSFAEVTKAADGLVKKIDAIGKETHKTDQISRQLGNESRRVWEQTRTATEKAAQEQALYNKLLRDGYIDFETFSRASSKLGRESQSTWGKLKEWAGGAIGDMVGITSATGGLLAALRLVGAELEANARRQDAAAAQARGEADPSRKVGFALGAGADLNRDQAIARAGMIAAETKVDRSVVLSAYAQAIENRGGKSARVAGDYLQAAFAADRGLTAEDAGAAASAAMKITELQGGSTEQGYGVLYRGMQAAGVGDFAEYSKAVNPGLNAMSKSGSTPQESLALFAAMKGQTDTSIGESTAAGLKFYEKLEAKAREARSPAAGKGLTALRSWYLNDPSGRIYGQRLLAELHGSPEFTPAMREFLTPGSKTAQGYEDALAAIPTTAGGGSGYGDWARTMQPGATEQVRTAGESALQRVRSDASMATIGELRAQLIQLREAGGQADPVMGWLKNKRTTYRLSDDVSLDEGYGIALDELEDMLPRQARSRRGRDPSYSAATDPLLSDAQKNLIASIDALRETIERQRANGRGEANGAVPPLKRNP